MKIFSLRKAPFVYPIPPPPATAVLKPWFSTGFSTRRLRSNGLVRVFPNGWDRAAAAFGPAAIAGAWPQLEQLLLQPIPSLTHAVIVLAQPGDRLLTTEDREMLWNAFRVPVFQQIVDGRGFLLAAECEAHAGLHTESPGIFGQQTIDSEPCGCGRKTPRIAVLPRATAMQAR